MGTNRTKRAVIAASFCLFALCVTSHRPAAAQAPATLLSEQLSLSVRACDAIIGGAAVDDAVNAAGMAPLSQAGRLADAPFGTDARFASFFGTETQIRSTAWEGAQGFIWLIVAADGSKCQLMGLGAGDLTGGAADGLATGPRGWQPVDGTQMRRSNGDLMRSETLITSGNRQIVFVYLTRGAALTGLAERFRLAVAACDAVISGIAIDDAAHAAGLTLSESARVADTPLGADPATGATAFFEADTQIRHVREQHPGGFFAFIVAADGSKCEALGVGQADLRRAAEEGTGAGGWSPLNAGQHQRANGDQVAIQQTNQPNQVQILDLKFVRGPR
jgi:hypothetical protein